MSLTERIAAAGGHLIEDVRRALAAAPTELAATGLQFVVVANITAPFSLTLLSAEGQALISGPRASQGRTIAPVDVTAAFAASKLPRELAWAVGAAAPIQGFAAYLLVGGKVRKLGWRNKPLPAGKVWRSSRLITANLLGD